MGKEYYSPDVKSYEPMAQKAMSNIIIDNTHLLDSTSVRRCLDYTPTSVSSSFYQPDYTAKIFREEPSHSGNKQFKSKEKRVMFYQPGRESLNRTGWRYTVSEKTFRGESLISKVIMKLLKKINRWFNRIKR